MWINQPMQKGEPKVNIEFINNLFSKFTTEFANMKLIEISRGCSRGCYFCITPCIYGKARFKNVETVMSQIYEEPFIDYVGLVGAAVSDYPYLDELLDELERNPEDFYESEEAKELSELSKTLRDFYRGLHEKNAVSALEDDD